MSSAGDRIVTTTYLNQALAKQTREFDERLSQQEGRFDQQLDALKEELKQFIDAKLGYIGARWGEDIENTYRNFAETIITRIDNS
jgi:hypothetical protein